MKKIILVIMMLSSFSSFAYTQWSDYTPASIFTVQKIGNFITRTVKIKTKAMVNTCNGLFEGFKYRVEVVHCTDHNLELKMEYKNKVDCDAGMTKNKTFKIKLPKGCEFYADPYFSSVTINQKTYKNH